MANPIGFTLKTEPGTVKAIIRLSYSGPGCNSELLTAG